MGIVTPDERSDGFMHITQAPEDPARLLLRIRWDREDGQLGECPIGAPWKILGMGFFKVSSRHHHIFSIYVNIQWEYHVNGFSDYKHTWDRE